MNRKLLDTDDVYKDHARSGDTSEVDDQLRGVIAADPMRLLHFNGN